MGNLARKFQYLKKEEFRLPIKALFRTPDHT